MKTIARPLRTRSPTATCCSTTSPKSPCFSRTATISTRNSRRIRRACSHSGPTDSRPSSSSALRTSRTARSASTLRRRISTSSLPPVAGSRLAAIVSGTPTNWTTSRNWSRSRRTTSSAITCSQPASSRKSTRYATCFCRSPKVSTSSAHWTTLKAGHCFLRFTVTPIPALQGMPRPTSIWPSTACTSRTSGRRTAT